MFSRMYIYIESFSRPFFFFLFFPFCFFERKREKYIYRERIGRDISDATTFASKLIAPRQEQTSRIGLLQLPTSAQSETKDVILRGARAVDRGKEKIHASCIFRFQLSALLAAGFYRSSLV